MLTHTNFHIAICRTLRTYNNILHCNVPTFQLPGAVISNIVARLRRVNIAFVASDIFNGSVAVTALRTRNCRTLFVNAKTNLPHFVNVPNRGTINILSTGRCLAEIGLVHTSISDDTAPVLGNHHIVIINNNGATVSSYHATLQVNTRAMCLICHHDRTRVPTHIRRIHRTGRRNIIFVALRGPVRCLASRHNILANIQLRIVALNRPSTSNEEGPITMTNRRHIVTVSRTVITINIDPGPVINGCIASVTIDTHNAVIISSDLHASLPIICTNNSVIHNNTAIILTVNSNRHTTRRVVAVFGR